MRCFFVKICQNLGFEGSQGLFQGFLSGGAPKILSGELLYFTRVGAPKISGKN